MKTTSIIILTFLCNCLCVIASETNATVIIIGAGPAGIAAATKLLENNHHSLLMLEAEPRIGGRINSVKFFNAYVDLGARWCHGRVNNIVYEIVKDMNLLGHNEFSPLLYHSSAGHVDDEFSEEIFSIIEDIYEYDGDRSGYRNLGEYCENKFNETVRQKFERDQRKLQFALSTTYFFENYVLGGEGAFSWYDVAADADYQECDGDKLQNWNGKGYKIFLDILMKKYPDPRRQLPIDDKILLNKEVSRIEWNEYARSRSKAVTIRCSDGSVYHADHVIFTPSIGVLKERAGNIFVPRLPENKMQAIENIGFGAVMKVIMHFPEVWWNFTGVNLMWSEEDARSATWQFRQGPNWNGYSWVTYMRHVLETEDNPNVMVAWFTGKLVPAIELLPDEALIEGITFALKKLLGRDYRVSKPDKIIKSQWYSNPHFRGVYSFQTPEAQKTSAERTLAEPLKNVEDVPILLFAGEASNPTHYSTVQGAVETGYREANRILNLID